MGRVIVCTSPCGAGWPTTPPPAAAPAAAAPACPCERCDEDAPLRPPRAAAAPLPALPSPPLPSTVAVAPLVPAASALTPRPTGPATPPAPRSAAAAAALRKALPSAAGACGPVPSATPPAGGRPVADVPAPAGPALPGSPPPAPRGARALPGADACALPRGAPAPGPPVRLPSAVPRSAAAPSWPEVDRSLPELPLPPPSAFVAESPLLRPESPCAAIRQRLSQDRGLARRPAAAERARGCDALDALLTLPRQSAITCTAACRNENLPARIVQPVAPRSTRPALGGCAPAAGCCPGTARRPWSPSRPRPPPPRCCRWRPWSRRRAPGCGCRCRSARCPPRCALPLPPRPPWVCPRRWRSAQGASQPLPGPQLLFPPVSLRPSPLFHLTRPSPHKPARARSSEGMPAKVTFSSASLRGPMRLLSAVREWRARGPHRFVSSDSPEFCVRLG